MKKALFLLFLLFDCLVAQNYMWPLAKGNEYQYIEYLEVTDGYFYHFITYNISSDTIIDQKKYCTFDNSGNFFRYDGNSNKAYLWYNGIEGVYCDFNANPDSQFIQYSPFSHNFISAYGITGSRKNFNIQFNTIGWRTAYGGGSIFRSEEFGEGLGIIIKVESNLGPPGRGYYSISQLINAILYDSLGNYAYFSNGYKPIITLQPFSFIGDSLLPSYSVEVNHNYNLFSKWLGTYREGVNYIDTVFIEYFYVKDSLKTTEQIVFATRKPVSNSYNFSIQLDTALIKNNYKMMYRIGAKDKSIIPVYLYSPDSGYYQAVYQPTSIEDERSRIKTFSLFQNYPNPFNPITKIKFSIPSNVKREMSNVLLKVYDILGNEVATLVNEVKPAGSHEIDFNAANLPSGVYFYQLIAGDYLETKKMLLLR